MKRRQGWVVGIAFLLGGASCVLPPPAQAGLHLDWQLKEVFVTPAAENQKLASGFVASEMRVHCSWTAVVTESGKHDTAIQWQGIIWWQGGVKETRVFNAKYPKTDTFYFKPGTKEQYTLPWEEANVYGNATNEFNRSASAVWKPTAPGTYAVGCEIALPGPDDGEFSTDRGNNAKSISFTVAPLKPVQAGTWPTEPTIAQPAEGALVLPNFTIVVKPHDPYQNCTQGGFIQVEKFQAQKVLSSPMVEACVAAGTSFNLAWPPGSYQVRARHFNKGRSFESAWSPWRSFTVIGAARGK